MIENRYPVASDGNCWASPLRQPCCLGFEEKFWRDSSIRFLWYRVSRDLVLCYTASRFIWVLWGLNEGFLGFDEGSRTDSCRFCEMESLGLEALKLWILTVEAGKLEHH